MSAQRTGCSKIRRFSMPRFARLPFLGQVTISGARRLFPWHVVLLVALFSALSSGALRARAAISWSIVKTGLDGHIFPSAAISLATTRSPYSPFAARLNDVPAGTLVK